MVPEPDSKKDDIKNKDLFTAGLLPKKEISDRTMPLPLCVSRDGHVKATPNAQGLCRVSTSKKSMLDPIMLEMQIERTKQRVAKLTLASQIALLDEQIEVAKKKRITGAEADSIEDSAPSPNFESTFQILHDQGAARDVDDNLLNSRAIFEPLNPYKDTKDSQKHFEIVGIIPTLSISAQAVPTNPSHKPPKNEAIANPTILEKDYEQVNLKKPITSEIRFPSAGCGAIIIVAPTSEEMTELANTEADTEQAVREENTRCVDVAEILTTDETTTIGSGCSLPSAGEISMNKQTMTVEETEGDLKPKAGKKEKVQNSASPVVDSEEGSTKEAAINEVCGRKVPSSEIDSLDDVTPTAEEMDEGSKVHVDAYEGLESTASPVVNSAEDPTMRVIATDGYKYACASPSFEEISRDDISIHEPAQISKQNAYGKHDDDKESSNLVDDKKPKKKLRKLRSFFKKVQQKSRRRIET